MPWQHWVVLGDILLSLVLVFWFSAQGYYQRSRKLLLLWIPWDLAVLYLLIDGASEWSWQFMTIAAFWGLGVLSMVKACWQRKREEVEPKTVVVGVVFCLALSTLLLTGQPG